MQKIIKFLMFAMSFMIIIGLITGCAKIKNNTLINLKPKEMSYFHKGVYKSYPSSENSDSYYFYIFYNENSGYTEDNKMGIGLPFSCIQENNQIRFKFGGEEEPEEILNIKSFKDDIVIGSFKDGKVFIFYPLNDTDIDNFDAIEYLKKHDR